MKSPHPIDLPGQPLRRGQARVVRSLPPYERAAPSLTEQLIAQIVAQRIHERDEWLLAQFRRHNPRWRRSVFLFVQRRVLPRYRRLTKWWAEHNRIDHTRLQADGSWRLPLRERLLRAVYTRYEGWLGDLLGWAHLQFSVVRVAGDPEAIAADIRGLRYWRGREDQPLVVSTEQPPF